MYPQYRFQLLLNIQAFDSEYIVSPSEVRTAWTGGTVTTAHYSFALRNISGSTSAVSKDFWKADENADRVMVSDRSITNNDSSTDAIRSVHTRPDLNVRDWEGTVCWNDNHAKYVTNEDDVVEDTTGGVLFDDPLVVYWDTSKVETPG